ncbi:MAG: glycosyltransferase [Prevotella sp.]|jgi:glycosyltransferase involved in cell wall biosynthesis|nr:glycosyltransferase [Prevotella sp.]
MPNIKISEMPEISVIVPNYNHAPFLKQRIDSILNQTCQDFELIILDDGSTDNSKEIIEQYRNQPKVSRIVYNTVNSGSPFKQWRKGIELAKGKYIWIAESDDFSDVLFLEYAMKSIVEYRSILAFCSSSIIDGNNRTLSQKPFILEKEALDVQSFLKQHLLFGSRIYNASMAVLKKEAIENMDWDKISNLKYCGDWLFWASLLKKHPADNVSEVKLYLNYFRTHNKNVSNKAEKEGKTFTEGLPVSIGIAKSINRKRDLSFSKQWHKNWVLCRKYYKFTKKTNLKIFFFFLRKQPSILFFEIKERFERRACNPNKFGFCRTAKND